jgi:ATP phosphoribosyltransferase regulatory subunit
MMDGPADPTLLNPALLPAGLADLLPPHAETEAAAVEAMAGTFAAHGYQRIKPPLLEFEDGLLSGSGAATAEQTFRLMDPVSQRMMGLRADITPQVARIAATRLASAPRPLRLSYSGQVLRVRGSQLNPSRQFAQAGIELIGPDSPEADAEVIAVGATALAAVGVADITVDLTLPTLAGALIEPVGLPAETARALYRALDRKDAAAVAAHANTLGNALAPLLTLLLRAAGEATRALGMLASATLPAPARALADRAAATVAAIRALNPSLALTLDPVEFRGWRYHRDLAFSMFARRSGDELGRGGRYLSANDEPATGLTLYPEAVLRAAPARPPRDRAFLPHGHDQAAAQALREGGFATVAALDPHADSEAEARRLNCTHILRGRQAVAL